MSAERASIQQLLQAIEEITSSLEQEIERKKELLSQVASQNLASAINLLQYHALRKFDLRNIQNELRNIGLSRLNNSSDHVMASLFNTQFILRRLLGDSSPKERPEFSIQQGIAMLRRNSNQLLGKPVSKRRVRIMVTQPTEAALDYDLVYQMVKAGMHCARINCAHDNELVWSKIIANIRRASLELSREVKIAMDLAGPKIRTGPVKPGPRVRKFNPLRDEMGNVVKPAVMQFVPVLAPESKEKEVPVDEKVILHLQEGDRLSFIDARGKNRKCIVAHKQDGHAFLATYQPCYITSETLFRLGDFQFKVGEIPAVKQAIILRVNDHLRVLKSDQHGEPAQYDKKGNLIRMATISSQLKEVFEKIKMGEKVLFDDGKIQGVVVCTSPEFFDLRITKAKITGSKLRAEKGINFPETYFETACLSAKDRQDLKFVAEHADIVNVSFVNSSEDVEELLKVLEELNALDRLDVVLKIETSLGFDNLHEILLTAMRTNRIGVLIARGDLAVETGWNNIGWIQREIINTCNAAHVPTIWATQVLENLAKKGLPSRSEITDATTSLKAECVMLNKGRYIIEAIGLLYELLDSMEAFHQKNENMMPRIQKLRKVEQKMEKTVQLP